MDILLEESTTEKITPLLYKIITIILSESKTIDSIQKDILFVLVVVLMLENGFALVNAELETVDPIQFFNSKEVYNWKSNTGVFEASLVVPGYKNVTVKLVLCPLGATALVNLVITELHFETYSVCIPVSRYVVSPQATSIPLIFRDLKHFSTTLKNNIVSPVKSRIYSHHGYASASLIGIPEEVLFKILICLSVEDICNVSKTCNRLKALLESESLWYDLCKRDFHNVSKTDVTRSWKNLYTELYASQQENRLRSTNEAAGALHDYMDYSDYVSYIDNPMWNVT